MNENGGGPPARMERLRRHVLLGRPGTTDDTAGACVYLASPMAAYVTGVCINVDGGTWASSGWSKDAEGRWQLFESFAEAY